MLRIRPKPKSAKSSRSPAVSRPEEQTPILNLSHQTSKASHKLQKANFGFFKLINTHKRPKIRQLNSAQSNKSSSKDSNSATLNPLHHSQLSILKEELELTWSNFKIPEQHRSLFLSSLQPLPSLQACIKIAREIDTIEKGSANISYVLNTIAFRESKLVDFQEKLKESPLDVKLFEKLIEGLREVSLKLVDFVEMWKREVMCVGEFVWEGVGCYEKMKTDSDFVGESELRRFFCFFKADPLFFGPTFGRKVGKRVFSVPFSSRLTGRIKRAQEVLGFAPVRPPKRFSAVSGDVTSTPIEPLTSSVSLFFQTEIAQLDPELQKFLQDLTKALLETLLAESVAANTRLIVFECCKEILLASLTLHSSSILDKIITEVLNEMIPSIARNSHTEVTDSEYLDIRNAILNEVFNEEIHQICAVKTNFLLSQEVTDEIFNFFDLKDLVDETIKEEKKENLKIVFFVAEKLVEEFINSDWAEEIAEIELISAKMESAWVGLPGHIQREIYLHQKKKIVERVGEMVYYSILNDFVGSLWLGGVIQNVWNEEMGIEIVKDEEVFVLKDPNVIIEDTKKPVVLKK